MTNDKQHERLVELLKAMNTAPEITCPRFNKEGCKGCEFDRGNVCDVAGREAGYLLANGVIVPPCRVGDTVYSIDNCINRPEMIVVTSIHHHKKHTFFSALSRNQREYCFEEKDIGKTVFLTKEEAEEALKGGVQG